MAEPTGDVASILGSMKKVLGIAADDPTFDSDLIFHINSEFATLHQLGVGPEEPFEIEDSTTEWSEFIEDKTALNSVRSLMYISVKLLFDPPATTTMFSALEERKKEYEWRLTVAAEDNYGEENQNG